MGLHGLIFGISQLSQLSFFLIFLMTLDLCSAPQCIGASVTREDLENAHEPNHRLIKVRTSVLTRRHGRVHTAACDAFGRVRETCRKIAESTLDSDEEARPDVQKPSSSDPTSTQIPVKGDKPDGTKMEPRSRVRPHEIQDGVKSRTKACPRVANAINLSPSLSGIAFFAKVSLRRIKRVTHPLLISHPIH